MAIPTSSNREMLGAASVNQRGPARPKPGWTYQNGVGTPTYTPGTLGMGWSDLQQQYPVSPPPSQPVNPFATPHAAAKMVGAVPKMLGGPKTAKTLQEAMANVQVPTGMAAAQAAPVVPPLAQSLGVQSPMVGGTPAMMGQGATMPDFWQQQQGQMLQANPTMTRATPGAPDSPDFQGGLARNAGYTTPVLAPSVPVAGNVQLGPSVGTQGQLASFFEPQSAPKPHPLWGSGWNTSPDGEVTINPQMSDSDLMQALTAEGAAARRAILKRQDPDYKRLIAHNRAALAGDGDTMRAQILQQPALPGQDPSRSGISQRPSMRDLMYAGSTPEQDARRQSYQNTLAERRLRLDAKRQGRRMGATEATLARHLGVGEPFTEDQQLAAFGPEAIRTIRETSPEAQRLTALTQIAQGYAASGQPMPKELAGGLSESLGIGSPDRGNVPPPQEEIDARKVSYPDRADFEQSLIADGYTPEMAAQITEREFAPTIDRYRRWRDNNPAGSDALSFSSIFGSPVGLAHNVISLVDMLRSGGS